ncbi:hypothetical protein JMF89_18445 [Clostridiaceae bacterium UIB06]|nr:hypothetical protein [Clostridiaceae bacterium UIB06]
MKSKLITSFFFVALLLVSPNVKAANFTDNQTVDTNKTWTIKFTSDVGLDDDTKQGITVTDNKGNPVSVDIKLGQDSKTVTVTAPQGGYIPGESYILNVGSKAHSKNGKALKNEYKFHFNIYKSSQNEIVPPDSTCLEVKYLPGQDRYGNDYWVMVSKEMILPKNYTLYVYYGWEDSADKISSEEKGNTVTWNENDSDEVLQQGNKLAAPPAQQGQYIYYRFVQGTSFNGESVSENPDIPEGTPTSKWIADGRVTDN